MNTCWRCSALRTGAAWAALAAAVLAVAVAGCGRRATPALEPQLLTLKTSDGVTLGATLYPARQENPPGLVLVCSAGAVRASWEPFALRARDAGYTCLAFDLRGHGGSVDQNGKTLSYKTFTTVDWMACREDIAAAWTALAEHGADPANRAVVGVSLGGNLALAFASEHTDVPAVVMVSPGLDYKGVKTESAIAALGERPVLLIAGKGDSYSATSCTTLKQAASGLCEIREYGGSAHGIDLLDMSDTARDEILLWLRPIIGKNLPGTE